MQIKKLYKVKLISETEYTIMASNADEAKEIILDDPFSGLKVKMQTNITAHLFSHEGRFNLFNSIKNNVKQ